MKKKILFSFPLFLCMCTLDGTPLEDPNDSTQELTSNPEGFELQCTDAHPVEIRQRVNDEAETNNVPSEEQANNYQETNDNNNSEGDDEGPVPCTCGVFLSGQFKKGSKKQPKGLPILTQEMDTPFMNNAMGNRQCTNKCLELIIKHLPKSSEIICATVDRDHVFKERAYLFIKNHSDKWHGTNLSAGREFCCRDNEPYKCPVS